MPLVPPHLLNPQPLLPIRSSNAERCRRDVELHINGEVPDLEEDKRHVFCGRPFVEVQVGFAQWIEPGRLLSVQRELLAVAEKKEADSPAENLFGLTTLQCLNGQVDAEPVFPRN